MRPALGADEVQSLFLLMCSIHQSLGEAVGPVLRAQGPSVRYPHLQLVLQNLFPKTKFIIAQNTFVKKVISEWGCRALAYHAQRPRFNHQHHQKQVRFLKYTSFRL
jgi:hypothetical protein